MGALRRPPFVLIGSAMIAIEFAAGTLEIRGPEAAEPQSSILPPSCKWDARTQSYRAPAIAYADVVRALHKGAIEYRDDARRYEELKTPARVHREPRPYQEEAILAWKKARGRGVVVLP